MPVAQDHVAYAKELAAELAEFDVDCEIYDKNESLAKRVRTAEKQKVPMIAIIGDEEVKNRNVAVRDRRKREQYDLSAEEFIKLIKEQTSEVRI